MGRGGDQLSRVREGPPIPALVAIDGPVGAGKTTVALAVARRLGVAHLDTGAMYRAVALAVLRRGLDPETASSEALAEVAREAVIEVEDDGVVLDGVDVTAELRSPAVGTAVSAVAARPEVRAELVERQRAWARAHGGGVVEGRDIGSVVFPDADLKVFLTASPEERARRREGDETAADVARRDRLDAARAASPLVQATGAKVIDTTGLGIDEVVDTIVAALPPPRTDVGHPPGEPAPSEETKPARGPELLLYRVCWALVQAICRTYWRASFDGLEHVPAEGPFVLAPVHRSFIDFGIVSGVTRRRLRYMGKAELWQWSPFGRFLSALGAFPVHRGGADREAMRRCLAVIADGEPLVLFPEGTRGSGAVVDDLHEGASYVALRTGVPIVPVGIGGSERALPKGSRIPRRSRVRVIVGPAILPSTTGGRRAPSRRAVRELTERLQGELQALFDQAQAEAN